jgi:ankyrin repeat protein
MWAAAENNAPAVEALLAAGAERDARSAGNDFTALTFATRAGALDSARALLDAGADPNTTLQGGATMLVLATINANFELAGMLLDYGADPNASAQGWTRRAIRAPAGSAWA